MFELAVLLMYFNYCKDFFPDCYCNSTSLGKLFVRRNNKNFCTPNIPPSFEQNQFEFYLELNYTIMITRKLQNIVKI